jgi:hypothetical protein
MQVEQSVRLLAGSMILLSLALAYFVSEYWLLLTLFVGVNLFQSALTGLCPAEKVITKVFYRNRVSTESKTGSN